MTFEISSAFICPITQDLAYEPVVCQEGHLFDAPAIRRWLLRANHCPVSRHPMSAINLHPVLPIRNLMPPRPVIVPIAPIDTEDHEPVPALLDVVTLNFHNINLNEPQFAALFADYDLTPERPLIAAQVLNTEHYVMIPSGYRTDFNVVHYSGMDAYPQLTIPRLVCTFNRRSNNPTLAIIHGINTVYATTHNLLNRVVQYRRYIIHSHRTLEQLTHHLARTGLYVHDLFSVGTDRFILYSFPRLLSGVVHRYSLSHQDRV